MVGRSKYKMPTVDTLNTHYNINLLLKKKQMRENIAKQERELEGRMTVEDYHTRQLSKKNQEVDPLQVYINNF